MSRELFPSLDLQQGARQMSSSLSDQAYHRIKTEILTCELRPGQQIAQQQLVERYEFGKTPVREALQRLAQENFVQPVPRFGYIVAPITLSDIHEIYELRLIAEPAAVRLAAVRGSDEQLEEIRQAAGKTYVYNERETYLEYLRHNTNFHCSIAVAAGNQRLADWIAKLLDELARVFHMGLDWRDRTEAMRVGHIDLVNALVERDPERASEIITGQINTSREQFLEALTHHLGTGSPAVQITYPNFKRA
jgi:DNA-binding GntR family transcriptional regulator